MRTPALATATAALVFGLAACTGTTTSPGGQQTPGVTNGEPSAATTATTGTTATPEATARRGQGTADEAAQAFLRAFGTGDAQGVCALMAAEGRPIAGDQAAVERCASVMQGIMDLVKDEAAQLTDATVTGATVSGDRATFENATITPELGKSVLESQTAVQVDGSWYIGTPRQ